MRWTESVLVDAPMASVHASIADEHELMAWSAWPAATGFVCAVEVGDGRSVGSEFVFRDAKGVEKGRQRLSEVSPTLVAYRLENQGPGGRTIRPEVDFTLADQGGGATRVTLDFRAELPLPPGLRQVAQAVAGRRLRALHRKDLAQLKAHVERAATPPPGAP